MSFFNSLGSNYNFKFVLSTFFARNKGKFRDELENFLKTKYGGKVILTYKGREAITLALKIAKISEKSKVAITGFTCWAVYKAIIDAGLNVEYLDIDPDNLNFTAETFRKALKVSPDIKALIVQNTLGYPCQIEQISKICKENKVLLIEDLAHCVGTKYESGLETGTIGDFVTLSFSQDKMIDSISGGALVIRNGTYSNFLVDLQSLNGRQERIDRLYPFFTFFIRKTYGAGFGKVFHFLLKATNLLSKPLDSRFSGIHRLPNWYCRLVKIAFKDLEQDLFHRRKIASVYAEKLNYKIALGKLKNQISLSSCLRFPIFVKNRASLISYLNGKNIYISDIWYDAPVSPIRFLLETSYQNECPNAEKMCHEILNLPTHKNVSEKDAQYIVDEVNQWLKLQ